MNFEMPLLLVGAMVVAAAVLYSSWTIRKALASWKESNVQNADSTQELNRRWSELNQRLEELEARETEFERQASEAKPQAPSAIHPAQSEATNHMVSSITPMSASLHSARFTGDELDSDAEALRILLECMERTAATVAAESTTVTIALPSDEMKGRLIGREGRNVKAFEQAAEVDLIIDQTPDAVMISSLNPLKREVARLALNNLLQDGRIQPARIEACVAQAKSDAERVALESGREAANKAGIKGLPKDVLRQLGLLKFRASLGQNLLQHSLETSQIASNLAHELHLDATIAGAAGLLHDIGKGLEDQTPGPHALIGMEFLAQHGVKEPILNAVGAHHREVEPTTPEAILVIVADSLSASRPGARRGAIDNYAKRVAAIEAIANVQPGVDRAFAVQSGRELRVFVHPNQMDDQAATDLANQLVSQIQKEQPQVHGLTVTVIREFRVQAQSK